jgi:integrase/recombinase XerC
MNELILSKIPNVTVDITGLVETFFTSKHPLTLKAYGRDLRAFQKWLGVASLEEAARLLLSQEQGFANALVISYKTKLIEEGLSSCTVNRRLAALSSLVKLARVVGLCSFVLEVKGVGVEPLRDARGPGAEGVRKLLACAQKRTDKKGKRDYAMLRLLYDLALRRGEVCSLDVEHANKEPGALWVLGKQRSQRQRITLPSKTSEALQGWLLERGEAPGPLFIGLDPRSEKRATIEEKRLTGDGLCLIIKLLGKKADVTVKPHGLRHASITKCLDASNGDLRKTRMFSRHKSINMVLLYDDARKDFAAEMANLVVDQT